MMTGAAATKKKVDDSPITCDFLASFVHSSPDPDPGGDVSPTLAARKGIAFARSPGFSLDFYPVSVPSAPAKGNGKRSREDTDSDGEFLGMTNEVVRRDIAGMSDGELRREIAGITTFRSLLGREERERRQRLLPLLDKDGDGCNPGARSSAMSVYTFNIEDEQTEDASRKYCQKMYSSKTSPKALCGRVHAVDPKEHDSENYRQNENNYYSNHAKRRSKSSVEDAIIVYDDASSDDDASNDDDASSDDDVSSDEDASSDEDTSSADDDKRSTAHNSLVTTKRPDGRKHAKEKGKKTGDDYIKESLNAIMNERKEMAEERKIMKTKEMEERVVAEQRKVVAEERMAAVEERRVAMEERRVAMEERKVAMEESLKAMEQEQKLMFMDTSHLDAKQKAYVEICRDQVLANRSMSMMGGFMDAMGGFMGGFMRAMGGSMGGMGGGSSANGAMAGGFGAHDAMGGSLGAHGSMEATEEDEVTHGDASDANAANVN